MALKSTAMVASAEAHLALRPIVTGRSRMQPGGSCLRPQGLPGWLLWSTSGGVAQLRLRQGERQVDCTDLVLIEPGIAHDYGNVNPRRVWSCWWAVFTPRAHWGAWLKWPSIAPGIMVLSCQAHADLRRIIVASHAAAVGGHHAGRDLAMIQLERMLIEADAHNPHSVVGRQDSRVAAAAVLLARDLDRPLTLWHVARTVGCSIPHLVRTFRASHGVPPLRFRQQLRLQRAAELLASTELSVTEIASATGFMDPFHFSSRFRSFAGSSPSRWRLGSRTM
jgi:AraC family transcriptional regulator, arabinose operon regulatory protein